ncbi:serine/threonine-protein kinase [Streptomyces kanamyceticus]|uniref:non-specific serine/threonine protein kinase n=1 Tax=Streptomyces kanamyceticus TaxID=1967 RepID=A0A5J6G8F9_STRKN|nr:serine/threonine-protein kinase [Streptomyces kanamyceticus]QEU92080.1 serine/threonine protein kinase [Streptomyces kanamyceticus]
MPSEPISDRYELLEELDHGGMGDVWRGYDTVLDRPVAVKLLRQASLAAAPHLAEEFAKRFQREARITARIQHPGVPQVYDAVLDASLERLFLVMELVDGVSLTHYVNSAQPMPIGWAAAVAAQVATVLSHAHQVPVIHRDLKPSNILVARDGTVKVLDFGIAAILRTDVTKLTATGTPIGTYQYMAPEQVRGGTITPRTDLYALGCVLHELLSGRLLFTAGDEFGLMYQHVSEEPMPLRQLRPEVPQPLEELVLRLLGKDPEERPSDTQEVYERLLPFLPLPGEATAVNGSQGPTGVPDPTALYRKPYAPRAREQARAADRPNPAVLQPMPVPAQLREDIRAARDQADHLIREDRFAQAVEVLGEVIEPAARALGPENKAVLALRRQRAAVRLLGGDYRAARPEFDTLADAYARIAGPTSEQARACRAQAARCRAELGMVTDALAQLREVLDVVRTADSDASEEALELRHNIGMLLLAQGRTAEAKEVLEPLYQDVVLISGPDDELAVEIAEALAVIQLGLDKPEPEA